MGGGKKTLKSSMDINPGEKGRSEILFFANQCSLIDTDKLLQQILE